ncbi:uncharacterized protein AMSG_04565 [Thecamonas trahens ATCC 50062]|uniref:Secreted protein n=1 Tax=Thecamonas trahens ATCC 50062 TaxID=461836 RepID=A0A0L0D9A6_THETB|nr:hypothetical protein AMSG_04565 [Thecamonas trahens ATCC 50062]KNC48820.1 hypothetical protein AMSG_04565 [Thecamonas trahens ATCC 50062]|eukprot:XP_013758240.1 hypothetical protein AMSG_04565 [Thecamonas trahens ATCC 50062]
MRLALVVAAAVCVLSLAVSARPLASTPEEDVLHFLEGLVEGLGHDVNVSDCQPAATKTLQDFDTGIVDLENGFRHKSVKDIYDGFEALGSAFHELGIAFEDCGEEYAAIAKDIKKIATELAEPDGVIRVVVEEVINIFVHEKQIVDDVRDLIAAWKAGQYYQAGVALGEIAGILLED